MGAPIPTKPTPLRNSYWVLPGKVLAGEHPGGTTRESTRDRLQRLMEAGVECFIDLTEPGEIKPYDPELPFSVEYLRKPIKDHGTPGQRVHMAEILDCIHDALQSGRCVYVHCRAGIGRTGTVVGCFLVERGLPGEAALDELNRLWQQSERSRNWASVPETSDQTDYVVSWKRRGIFDDNGGLARPGLKVDDEDEVDPDSGSTPWAHLLLDGQANANGAQRPSAAGHPGALPPNSTSPPSAGASRAPTPTRATAPGAAPNTLSAESRGPASTAPADARGLASSPPGGASPVTSAPLPVGPGASRAAMANAARAAAASRSDSDDLLTDPTAVEKLPQPATPVWTNANSPAASTPPGTPSSKHQPPSSRPSASAPAASNTPVVAPPAASPRGPRPASAQPNEPYPTNPRWIGANAPAATTPSSASGTSAASQSPGRRPGTSGAAASNTPGGANPYDTGAPGASTTDAQSPADQSGGLRSGRPQARGTNTRGGAVQGASSTGTQPLIVPPGPQPSGTPDRSGANTPATAAGAAKGAAAGGEGRLADRPIFPDADDDADPLLAPEALAAASTLRSRFLGALIGLAVGDAVAAATQYRRPGSFTPVGDMLGGGPFDLPRGGWSDDTAMALCLADSLLERNGFDARDQVERYRRWQQEGYLSATGQCVGITASSARAIAMAQWRRQAFFGSHDPSQQDPEPLSRVAPAVLFFFATSGEAITQATEAARTTCQAPAVLDACRALARAVHAALSSQPKAVVLEKAALAVPLSNADANAGARSGIAVDGADSPARSGAAGAQYGGGAIGGAAGARSSMSAGGAGAGARSSMGGGRALASNIRGGTGRTDPDEDDDDGDNTANSSRGGWGAGRVGPARFGGAGLPAGQAAGGPGSVTAPRVGSSASAALAAAVAAFGATDNFRDAILYAVNLGGDSDVVAAACGQLAGAYYGVKAIPTSWYNGLMQKELIASYADRLLAHAMMDLGG